MDDKLVYMFISFMAFINFIILIKSSHYNQCYCNQKKTPILLTITMFIFYMHYFIHCFGLYGFLFNNKGILLIYLAVPITVCICWKLFTNKYFKSACVLTNYTDILCNLPEKESIYFDEIYRTLGVPDINVFESKTNIAFICITIIGYCIALYKLFKK